MSQMSHLDPDKDLGIKLTNAEPCQCWIDRVALAKMRFDRGNMKVCQRAIGGAKRYAI